MCAHAAPVKTQLGRLALRDHDFVGSRAQRALLIMLGGRSSLDRLAPVMNSLGLGWQDLKHLADEGLVTWLPSGTKDGVLDIGL